LWSELFTALLVVGVIESEHKKQRRYNLAYISDIYNAFKRTFNKFLSPTSTVLLCWLELIR
jgi:hypothetical protein